MISASFAFFIVTINETVTIHETERNTLGAAKWRCDRRYHSAHEACASNRGLIRHVTAVFNVIPLKLNDDFNLNILALTVHL